MAIVVYKCDICKREKEFQRNIEGLEKVQRCTITHGCRGKLFQSGEHPDYIRATAPDRVLGLDEWRQRKVLHNHTQTIARSEWTIEHNLGTFPSISVFVNIPVEDDLDNVEEIIVTDTIVIDENNIKLTFDRSWAGTAQLVARQSDPDLLRPFTRQAITTTELQQISNVGEIVIASRISTVGENSNIDLVARYSTTQNTIVNKTYIVSDDVVDSTSTWRDFEKVVIKGKIYTIRSYSGIGQEMYDEIISSGSTFRFTGIVDYSGVPMDTTVRDIQQDEVYILFASEPFTSADKLTDQYIDIFDITETENAFSLLYDSGEFFAQRTIIQNIYPLIRSV